MYLKEQKIKVESNPFFFQLVQNFVYLLFIFSTFPLSAQVDTIYESRAVCEHDLPFVWRGVTFRDDSTAQVSFQDTLWVMNVAVSRNPITSVTLPTEVCAGDQFFVTYGYNEDMSVQLGYLEARQTFGDVIFIPDGIPCAPYGTSYISNANFANFPPNSVIESVEDILYLRLKIEHSAIEDLEILLVCPNGSSSIILPDYQSNNWDGESHYFRTNFGMANRQEEVVSCDSTLNSIGVPWNYIWSNNTTQGYDYAAGVHAYCFETANIHSRPNPYWDAGSTSYMVDSSNVATMQNLYHPYQSFSNLIGCPLNGTWSVEIHDLWENDNGYLVEWELALSRNLHSGVQFPITQHILEGPWAQQVLDTLHSVSPPYELSIDTLATYRVAVQDSAGCTYDTLLNVQIHPNFNIDLYDTVCSGELPLEWDGLTFTSTGVQTQSFTTELGCDSIVNYHLLEQIDFITYRDTMVCAADLPIEWHGNLFSEAGELTQTYTSVEGCDSIVTLRLRLKDCIRDFYFPNAISPNGDGLNDYLFMPEEIIESIADFDIFIYNRWGKLIFHSRDKYFQWFGEEDGKVMENNIVSYVIVFYNHSGRKFIYKGSLTIL